MQLWEKILQLALLGSERTHLEPMVETALRQYQLDPEEPLPQVILSGAAAVHQIRRLHLPTTAWEYELTPAADDDHYEEIPAPSFDDLKEILAGPFRQALPEFVSLLRQRQVLLPPEFLPDLLERCRQDPELWDDIQPLLGDRADWLIRLHPQWRVLRPHGDHTRWERAGHEERLLIFRSERKKTPEGALELLSAIWQDTAYRKKLAYLEVLQEDLGVGDEDFLEQALTDSRKEIRLKAADLLAHIPESQLIKRIFGELIPLFTIRGANDRLEVDLPEDIPQGTARDGIQAGVKKGKRGGMKVNWLFECVRRVPPGVWMAHFDWTREELIRYFDSTNRSDLLLEALGSASLRFGDAKLGAQLIRYLVFKNDAVPGELDWKALARKMPTADFQRMAEDYFQRRTGLLEEKQLLTLMLEQGLHPWTKTMSRQIINGLKQWMSESKTFLWNLWHYKRLLETAGYASPMGMLDELAADWPMQSPVWNQWAPEVERMLRVLRFRKKMKENLQGGIK